ncbi:MULTISPECIES: cupin domain-containing protein [Priestia]|uniref:cupin domain-containing protein n=1 Tax=Priestia TaxID=2800373 RepID=UPI00064F1374|nr:cupin domain-containing protein [Priestia aryabhattai]KML30498.1 cupin [Priestia aryabhattai]KMN99970.1 cupin [Priestia aryabhattai]KZE12623.1 cupin [Priestia aryabhattai]MBY0005752.1 cupin domain-containing protein [Priestia aryabhattai]MBY0049512.1 cupin domain-containing protein [Priestia aryabhattai]
MSTPYMDYNNPNVQYFSDVNKNRLNTRNDQNYINRLGRDVLNTLGNVSLLDIYLSKSHVVEPHYHQNAAELVYCISGSAVVSLINPFNNEVTNIPITPGQVANIPQGWWHWEIASEDNTHLLAIFDAPYPEYIFGSDILNKTPIEVLAHTYCLDPEQLKKTLAPLKNQTIVIGPTDECGEKEHYKKKKQGGPVHHQKPTYTYPPPQNPYYSPQNPYHYRYW